MYLTTMPEFKGEVENKYVRYSLHTEFPSVSTTTERLDCCEGIAQGLGPNERIGDVVRVRQIRLSGFLVGGQTNVVTDDAYNSFRIVVFSHTVGSTITFSMTDLLDPRFNQGLRRVFYDQSFALPSPGRDSTGYMPAVRKIEIAIPLNFMQLYTGSGATAVAQEELAIGMVSDSVGVPNPGFESGSLAVCYADL